MSDLSDLNREVPARSTTLLAAALVAVLWVGPAVGQAAPPGSRLESYWSEWLQRTSPLLTEEERLYFGILEDDVARERFARGLWESRGSQARERWRRNRQDAMRLRSRSPSRERAVQLIGKPGSIETYSRCGALRRLEVWRWEPWHLSLQGASVAEPRYLVFVEATTLTMRSFEPWKPGHLEGLTRGPTSYSTAGGMIEALASGTCASDAALSRLGTALERASSFEDLRRLAAWPAADGSWLRELREQLHEDPPFDATLELAYLGAYTRYTIVHGRVRIPVERLEQLVPGYIFDRVTISGDVFRGGRLVDAFELVQHVAGAAPGPEIEIGFYRRLEPGTHRLHLRVADRYDLALLRENRELEVPESSERAPEPAGSAEGYSRLTRAELVQLNTFPSVELLPAVLGSGGRLNLRAITTGGPIDSVEFRVAGETLRIDDQPPYTLELDPVESLTTLEAVALDPARRPLADDSRLLEPASLPFSVRFDRPRAGEIDVRVRVEIPADQEVESFECRRARRLIFSSTGPPFRCPLPGSPGAGVDYLTATVVLTDGAAQEDVLYLGSRPPEEVEVQLAELYLSILDRDGRPARGLGADDVRVWEGGLERTVERVQPVDKLPLNVAVLMDISSSMGRSLAVAAESAQDFFERVLREGDLASLLAFNHDLHALVPFTGSSQALRYGAEGLRAWGATRLHGVGREAGLFQSTTPWPTRSFSSLAEPVGER